MIAKIKSVRARCSFCGRSKGEVLGMVAGAPQASPGVPRQMVGKSAFICSECVRRCVQIIAGKEISTTPAIVPV
jgi:hypothetical protein